MFFHDDDVLQRVPTVSRKSERLVNLTIALLATKRYLTKAEIFKNVAGYEGDAEARDRMFERDKDDLRTLGINIELGTFDPLFEDEAGYRIKPEKYALQLTNLDSLSIALLSQAGKMWQQAALGESAQSGLRKLKSLGVEPDIDAIVGITAHSRDIPEQLPDLIEAVTQSQKIAFEYLNDELVSQVRNVEPYRLSNSRGYWYLIGRDIDKSELRTFRVDRISTAITTKGNPKSFEIDSDALVNHEKSNSDSHQSAKILVRKGKAHSLRSRAEISEFDSEWDLLELSFHNESALVREILWAGEGAHLLEPQAVRARIVQSLKSAVENHG